MAKCAPIILTPFFQLRDEDAVEQRMVENAVLGQQTFTVWCNSDGRIQTQPTSDGLLKSFWRGAD